MPSGLFSFVVASKVQCYQIGYLCIQRGVGVCACVAEVAEADQCCGFVFFLLL